MGGGAWGPLWAHGLLHQENQKITLGSGKDIISGSFIMCINITQEQSTYAINPLTSQPEFQMINLGMMIHDD